MRLEKGQPGFDQETPMGEHINEEHFMSNLDEYFKRRDAKKDLNAIFE